MWQVLTKERIFVFRILFIILSDVIWDDTQYQWYDTKSDVFVQHMIISNISSFMQLGLNMSNGVTDTLESSSILIYLVQVKGIYTQQDTFN